MLGGKPELYRCAMTTPCCIAQILSRQSARAGRKSITAV
ncbi:hypothetical protein XHC_2702 [Xanthomonas hortorum pv. carotae str. M081]|nr:hypothetical protein XHC_2702 [Xanthomonas hortorum pv. carotae str. M081]